MSWAQANWSAVCFSPTRSSLGESGPITDRLALAMGEVVQRVGRFFLHHPDVPFLGFSPHTRRSYLLLSFLRSARGNEILLCALCVLSVFSKRQKGHKGHKGERNNTI